MTPSGGDILLGLSILVGAAVFFLIGVWRMKGVPNREDRPRAAGAIFMTLVGAPPRDERGAFSDAEGRSGGGEERNSVEQGHG